LVLYYNSEVWNIPCLGQALKHSLFVASATALPISLNYPDGSISFMDLHKIAKRATPEMFCRYKMLSCYTGFLMTKCLVRNGSI
jgi:hypothetical protein